MPMSGELFKVPKVFTDLKDLKNIFSSLLIGY